jgi:hypothetical protein
MPSRQRAVTGNFILRNIVKRIPDGVKRMILLSSLIAYIANTSDPEREFVRNINDALKLTRGSDASLEFPIRLSRVFWGNRQLFEQEFQALTGRTSLLEKERAALRVAAMVPDWFAYGKREEIAHDIAHYFSLQMPVCNMA